MKNATSAALRRSGADVKCLVGERKIRPDFALIAYTHEDSHPNDRSVVYVSHHPIRGDGDDQHIGPGRALSEEALVEMLSDLQQSSGLRYLSADVLAAAKDQMVWWTPPQKVRLWWKPVVEHTGQYGELPTRNAVVPVPGLVFHRKASSLSVWALAGVDRPTPQTPLYHAPFANVYDAGGLCFGDVSWRSDDHQTITEKFFASVFTHDVGSLQRAVGYEHSHLLWEALAAAKPKTFPVEVLRPINFTLAKVLNSKVAHG